MTGFHAGAQQGRLPWPTPGELDSQRRALYDDILGGPRGSGPQAFPLADAEGRLHGPFNAMLIAPLLGSAVQELGAAIRYRTSLTDRGREIAILVLAAYCQSDFEWYAHERVGLRSGLRSEELQALKELTGPPPTFDTCESTIFHTTIALLEQEDLDDKAFAAARAELGVVQLNELTILVGYYRLLSLSLRVWRTPMPDDE